MIKNIPPSWVRGVSLALMLAAFICSVRAQGIIYATPSQPINYGPAPTSQTIDITGSGNADFTLVCDGAFGSFLYPQGNNTLVIVPLTGESDQAVGASLVAALNPGDMIGGDLSSLSPVYQWFNVSVNTVGNSCLADQNSSGQLGYFYSQTAYIGFDLINGGQNYYGWMEVQNPFPVASGSIVAWAYETNPNTPIAAGAVPEPSTGALLSFGGLAFWVSRRKKWHGLPRHS